MFGRLHHVAYRCRDAQRTVDFYTSVVGLKYVAGLMPPENSKPSWPLNEPGQPARKVVGEEADSIHIFFELAGDAQKELKRWNELKKRKYAAAPAAKDKIPAMPADSTIVNA